MQVLKITENNMHLHGKIVTPFEVKKLLISM